MSISHNTSVQMMPKFVTLALNILWLKSWIIYPWPVNTNFLSTKFSLIESYAKILKSQFPPANLFSVANISPNVGLSIGPSFQQANMTSYLKCQNNCVCTVPFLIQSLSISRDYTFQLISSSGRGVIGMFQQKVMSFIWIQPVSGSIQFNLNIITIN